MGADGDGRLDDLLMFMDSLSTRTAELEAVFQTSSRRELLLYYSDNQFDTGDTSWLLSATSLVLFMTLPGLALYYAGMVRVTNVLATVMQVISIACLVSLLWMIVGYSLAFGPANAGVEGNSVYGDGSRIWLRGMSPHSFHQLAPSIPEPVFCAYQLTFAVVTPALIAGSFADRMKFYPMLIFVALWHVLVYCPICHSFWHPDGFLYKANSLDYAGGNVVHISSGISGLVSATMLGHRKGFGLEKFEPHNIIFSFMGACMLWVGWFGFNAGSALAADGRASYALLVTHISAATTCISWTVVEWIQRGKPSVLGAISGAVAGLVCITPGSGFVNPNGAFFVGLFGGPLCYLGCQLKHYFGFDDALDAFGVHAVGGIIGVFATGLLATADVGGFDGLCYDGSREGWMRLGKQVYGIVVTVAWSTVGTYIILKSIDLTIGLRVSAEDELRGLDNALHGESLTRSNHEKEHQRRSLDRFSSGSSNRSHSMRSAADHEKEQQRKSLDRLSSGSSNYSARSNVSSLREQPSYSSPQVVETGQVVEMSQISIITNMESDPF